MKRSEMVRQIGRELRAQSSGNTDIDADQLLSFIEAAGMLPPFNETEGYATESMTEFYEWEPEDEKKAM